MGKNKREEKKKRETAIKNAWRRAKEIGVCAGGPHPVPLCKGKFYAFDFNSVFCPQINEKYIVRAFEEELWGGL
jgi:hypothetical protein